MRAFARVGIFIFLNLRRFREGENSAVGATTIFAENFQHFFGSYDEGFDRKMLLVAGDEVGLIGLSLLQSLR